MQRIGAAGAGAISFNDDEPVETPETTTVRPSPAGGLADDAFDELVTPRAPQTLEEQLLKGGSKSIFSWGQNNTVCDDLRGSDPLAQSSDRISNAQAQGMRQESSLETLASMIDRGAQPRFLVGPDRSNPKPHYVNVCSYARDTKGRVYRLSVADPATGVVRTVTPEMLTKSVARQRANTAGTGQSQGSTQGVAQDAGAAQSAEGNTQDPLSALTAMPARAVAGVVKLVASLFNVLGGLLQAVFG